MRKFFLVFVSVLSSVLLFSQNLLIPRQQSVWCNVPIVYPKIKDTTSILKITPKNDINYRKFLCDKIESGSIISYQPLQIVNSYDYSFVKQSVNNFRGLMGGGIDTIIIWNESQKKETVNVIITPTKPNDIQSLDFIENWNFDTTKLRFTKDVNAIIINRHYYRREDIDSNEVLIKKVGIIKKTDKISGKLIPYRTVRYSYNYEKCVSFSSDICDKDTYCPMLTPYIWSTLIHSIISKIETQKYTAYDFTTEKSISANEAMERMGKKIDTIGTAFGEKLTIEIQAQESEIKAITFTEDWFIDEKTCFIYKKVTEIGLIREWDDYVTNTHKIRPVFYIKLNN